MYVHEVIAALFNAMCHLQGVPHPRLGGRSQLQRPPDRPASRSRAAPATAAPATAASAAAAEPAASSHAPAGRSGRCRTCRDTCSLGSRRSCQCRCCAASSSISQPARLRPRPGLLLCAGAGPATALRGQRLGCTAASEAAPLSGCGACRGPTWRTRFCDGPQHRQVQSIILGLAMWGSYAGYSPE